MGGFHMAAWVEELGASLLFSWPPACDAREFSATLRNKVSEVSVLQSKAERRFEVGRNEVCNLCEEFAGEALHYLQQNKTQTEIIDMLHKSCSRLHSLEQQCILLVDYAPLFFFEISTIHPEDFCEKVALCEVVVAYGKQFSQSSCDLCHLAVSEVVSLLKDPDNQVSLENGTVVGFDIRTAICASSSESKPNFTLHAHDKAVCAISYNPVAPNLLATLSSDKMVKLWDLSNNQPSCIASQNPKDGAVFSMSFSEDSPFLLAVGGSKGNLELWDTLSDAAISRGYGKYAKQKAST